MEDRAGGEELLGVAAETERNCGPDRACGEKGAEAGLEGDVMGYRVRLPDVECRRYASARQLYQSLTYLLLKSEPLHPLVQAIPDAKQC